MADKKRIFLVVFTGVIFLVPMLLPSLRFFLRSGKEIRQETKKNPVKMDLGKSVSDTGSKRTERREQPRNEKVSDVQDGVLNYRLQSNERITRLQTALQRAGYYHGEIDGRLGPGTKRAIKKFQRAKGLTPDGIVGEKTWKALSQYLKD